MKISKELIRTINDLNLEKTKDTTGIIGSNDYLMKSGEYTDRYNVWTYKLELLDNCKWCNNTGFIILTEKDRKKGERISDFCVSCGLGNTLYIRKR